MTYKNSYTGFSRFLSIPHFEEKTPNITLAAESCYSTDSKIRSKLCKYLVDISDPHGLYDCKVTLKKSSLFFIIINSFKIRPTFAWFVVKNTLTIKESS